MNNAIKTFTFSQTQGKIQRYPVSFLVQVSPAG